MKNKIKLFSVLVVAVSIGIAGCSADNNGVSSNTKKDTSLSSSPTPGAVLSPAQFKEMYDAGESLIIDVREKEEYDVSRVKDTSNLPLSILRTAPDMMDTIANKNDKIIIYCKTGNRSAEAVSILKQNGFTNVYDGGGITQLEGSGVPIVKQ